MARRLPLAPPAALVLLLGAASAMLAAQEPSVFRSTAGSVPVYVTVLDDDERLVTNLVREDFEVRDNGRPQPITVFDNSPQPIRLIVMIDVSGSMAGNVALLRGAADALFTRLAPDDLVRVGTFGREITITPSFTNDVAALRAAMPESIPESAATPLWEALDRAVGELSDVDGRPVILVLSDGKDSMAPRFGKKFISQLEVVEHAQREEVMIYAVGLHSRGTRPVFGMGIGRGGLAAMMEADLPHPGLGAVAVETGGGYFEIRPRDDLAAAFARVSDELHSQYLIGFAPAQDGKKHDIDVRLKNKRGLEPRARKNYIAPRK